MATVTVHCTIRAPAEVVFRTIADPRRFAQAIAGVTNVEFLSEAAAGVGTRFRQTRMMHGTETTMDFEVTECVDNERVRIVNETHGTTWDSVFTLAGSAGSTDLTMRMEAKPNRLLPRLMLPLICRLIKKAVANDLDAVKAYCEGRRSGSELPGG